MPRPSKDVRKKIKSDWNSTKRWKTLYIDSDIEELVEQTTPAPLPSTRKKSKPIVDYETSFVVSSLCYYGQQFKD